MNSRPSQRRSVYVRSARHADPVTQQTIGWLKRRLVSRSVPPPKGRMWVTQRCGSCRLESMRRLRDGSDDRCCFCGAPRPEAKRPLPAGERL